MSVCCVPRCPSTSNAKNGKEKGLSYHLNNIFSGDTRDGLKRSETLQQLATTSESHYLHQCSSSTETRNIGVQVDVLVTNSRKECTPAVIVRPSRAQVACVNTLQMKLNSMEMSQPKKVSQVDQQYQHVL